MDGNELRDISSKYVTHDGLIYKCAFLMMADYIKEWLGLTWDDVSTMSGGKLFLSDMANLKYGKAFNVFHNLFPECIIVFNWLDDPGLYEVDLSSLQSELQRFAT